MKTLIIALAIIASISACNNNPQQNTLNKQQVYRQIKDSIQLDSFRRAEAEKTALAEQEEKQAVVQKTSSRSTSTPRRTYVQGVSETYTASQPQKKGWSKAAKGAAIGAGAGAVTGIIVDKKDGRGAVVGGLV